MKFRFSATVAGRYGQKHVRRECANDLHCRVRSVPWMGARFLTVASAVTVRQFWQRSTAASSPHCDCRSRPRQATPSSPPGPDKFRWLGTRATIISSTQCGLPVVHSIQWRRSRQCVRCGHRATLFAWADSVNGRVFSRCAESS